MTKFQNIAVIAAILFAPVSGYSGKVAADWVLSFHHKDCNTQAREFIAKFPADQWFGSIPAFECVR